MQPRAGGKVYTAWCWAGCGASTAFWVSTALAAGLLPGTAGFRHRCMRRWAKDQLWLSRTEVWIEGLDNVDRAGPQVFVANHTGFHDILALAAHLPVPTGWVAKKSLFSVPFIGWHMRRSGYVAIDRDNPRAAARSLVAAAAVVRGGGNLLAFPEGTRSRTGELGAFRSGAFVLALKSGAPLVPIALEGSSRVIAPRSLRINPGHIVQVRIGRPIQTTGRSLADKRRLMDEARAAIGGALAELRRSHFAGGAGGSPEEAPRVLAREGQCARTTS